MPPDKYNFKNSSSTKLYVVGTQKNRLDGMILLSTQNIHMFEPMDKKIIKLLRSIICFNICTIVYQPYCMLTESSIQVIWMEVSVSIQKGKNQLGKFFMLFLLSGFFS